MYIQDKRTNEKFSEFPNYGKHDIGGNHYGYLIVTPDNRVFYFYLVKDDQIGSDISYDDVSHLFDIIH